MYLTAKLLCHGKKIGSVTTHVGDQVWKTADVGTKKTPVKKRGEGKTDKKSK